LGFQSKSCSFERGGQRENARACARSLSPTRSAQTPHVASSLQRRYGETCAAKILLLRGAFTSPPGKPAFASSPQGPPHTPPRERERDPLHPRCLPSMSIPKRVGSSALPAVSSLANPFGSGAFCFLRAPRLDKAGDRQDRAHWCNSSPEGDCPPVFHT